MMKFAPAVLVLLVASSILLAADLETFRATYDKQRGEIMFEHGSKILKLNESYSKSLNNLSERATGAGDLDKARAIMAETERFAKEKTVTRQTAETSSPDLKKVQLAYLQNIQNMESVKAKKIVTLVSQYDSALGKLQSSLTRQKKLDDALAVQNERTTVAASDDVASARAVLSPKKRERKAEAARDLKKPTDTKRPYVEFDGDGCVVLGTPSDVMNGGKATYQAWLYPSIKNQTGTFIWDGNDRSALDRVLRFSEGRISVTLNASPYITMISKSDIPEQEWSHISLVVGRTSLAIYINGKLDSKKHMKIPSHDNASYISLGRGVFRGALFDKQFFGKMSDVRLWRRSLTEDEILKVYKGMRIKTTGLIGIWDFEKGKYSPSEGKKYESVTLGEVQIAKE